MQRKVVLTLALVLCLATSVQAALSIVNSNHTYPVGTTQVAIPIIVGGTDGVANFTANVEIADPSFVTGSGNFPSGPSPTITFLGNTAPLGTATATGDYTGNFMAATSHNFVALNGDDSFNSDNGQVTNPAVDINPQATNGGLLMTLLVDFTGFNSGGGTWRIIMDGENGNGPTVFGNIAGQGVPVDLGQANFTVSIAQVPEPASVVLGLFAVAGLGIVAIRKRRARRA